MQHLGWILEIISTLLNLAAGLLLTPEAVGKERMSRFEKNIKSSLERTIRQLELSKTQVIQAEKDLAPLNFRGSLRDMLSQFGIPIETNAILNLLKKRKGQS